MGRTKIQWSEYSWNPISGCSATSEGCRNCFAARMAATRLKHHPRYEGLAVIENGRARWTGEVRLNDVLDQPLHWRKPRRVFVASMGDLFHPDVYPSFICGVWQVMRECPQHTFQILTKRPRRMLRLIKTYIADHELGIEPLPNVHLGVSVENQAAADERIPLLLQTPAAVHYVSVEPYLSVVDLMPYLPCPHCDGNGIINYGYMRGHDCACKGRNAITWVICGGESGPGARPMDPDWVRDLRDQCQVADVPFFFKSWGAWLPLSQRTDQQQVTLARETKMHLSSGGASIRYEYCYRVGKKRAGNLLDGRTWNEMPKEATCS